MKTETSEDLNKNLKAFSVLIVQIIAWSFLRAPFYEDYNIASDTDGIAMTQGLAYLFITIPGMIFIFFTTLYLLSIKDLSRWFKFIAILNFIGLLFTFNALNW
ncbi:hypothetical protein BCU68_00515 [Vibrio sp. 10N.286.49.B3]|uniref:hypothetical protein n=1 Tax=Vibrio sp. 10N.286.49.B3 TaxID=1880855 RepID=UPI000C85CDB7|nr:hypothetical protein [Vibrio sp. 10N.286.49.B3]PMH46566.1 hypothetical protein BCU68_00515 [Vibrio sp. 10N.286.49.B3]